MFNALQVEKDDAGYRCTLAALDESKLPDGDVTVRVEYSTINYKDALAITGRAPVIRKFPLTPGIDCAGVVEASSSPSCPVGASVDHDEMQSPGRISIAGLRPPEANQRHRAHPSQQPG